MKKANEDRLLEQRLGEWQRAVHSKDIIRSRQAEMRTRSILQRRKKILEIRKEVEGKIEVSLFFPFPFIFPLHSICCGYHI